MSEPMTPEQEVAILIERSRRAQQAIADYTQEQVDELIRAMVYSVAREDRSEEIAQFTVDETQLGILNIQPQPWKVADNRVYAFVHAHDYLDGSLLSLDDGILSAGELEQIGQLSANAEAGLYRQGDHALFWIAEEIDRLTYLAVTGDIAAFEEGVRLLKRGIPARPDPGE